MATDQPIVMQPNWRPLRHINLYRILLSSLFLLLYYTPPLPEPLGVVSEEVFYQTSVALFVLGLLSLFTIERRWPTFEIQLHLQAGADIALLTVLIHASGGIGSGVEMLLLVSVANASLLVAGRSVGLFAAFAAIAVLVEESYSLLTISQSSIGYPQAGFFGVALFASAYLVHVLAKRARESERLASERQLDLADMSQTAQYVIERMDTGVMVVDVNNQIRFINTLARRVLKLKMEEDLLEGPLMDQLYRWRENLFFRPFVISFHGINQDYLPRMMPIGHREDTLIFLENASLANRQAQQLKLASLGRLTASIAHEIKNPLGAISHAGELLGESAGLEPQQERLAEIILEHSRRIERIVDSVTQLGRRDSTHPVTIELDSWLPRFIEELRQLQPVPEQALSYRVDPPGIALSFDSNHLHQILTNLSQNGLRHAAEQDEDYRVRIIAAQISERMVAIDVIDSGPGIPVQEREKIFEPFYTKQSRGSGLGLYICRELASANRAQLSYLPTAEGMSRFRLQLVPQDQEDSSQLSGP